MPRWPAGGGAAGQLSRRTLAATIVQHNPLFSAQKQLQLQLQNGQLQRYEVVGTQKLMLFDTLRYSAAGQVEQ